MINAELGEDGLFHPIDPTIPLGANLEELGIEDPELPENIYCEEKDFN